MALPLSSWAWRMEVDFSKIPHGFGPELFKAVGQPVCEFLVPDKNGSKSPFRDKGMAEAEDDGVIIDDVERIAKFSRVPDSGHVFQVNPVEGHSRTPAQP